MRKISLSILFVIFTMTLAFPLIAKVKSGNISGLLMDYAGEKVPNAKIVLSNGKRKVTQESNQNGEFHFLNLVPGVYQIDIQEENYYPYHNKIELNPGGYPGIIMQLHKK